MRFLPLLLVLVACGEESSARRVWRASDHTQPEGRPQGQTAAQDAPVEPSAPVSEAERRANAAKALFDLACKSCHGAEGLGNGPAAGGLSVPSLVTPGVQAASDEELRLVITRGRNAMPAFGDRLSEDAIVALVEHIRSLSAAP